VSVSTNPDIFVLYHAVCNSNYELLEHVVNGFVCDDRQSCILNVAELYRLIQTQHRTIRVVTGDVAVYGITCFHLCCVDERRTEIAYTMFITYDTA